MADDKHAKELEILRQELDLNIGAPWFAPRSDLDDIHYALTPPVHEGHYPPYGAIFIAHETLLSSTPSEPPIPDIDVPVPTQYSAPRPSRMIELRATQVQQARLLADGRHAFMVRTPTAAHLAYFPQDVGAEFALSSLVLKTGGRVVQRDRSGLVRLFTHTAIHYHRERRWKSMPSMDGDISHLLIQPPMSNLLDLMPSLLHFAYYHLSATGVGATFIWCLHERVLEKHPISDEQDIRWAQLNVMRREDMPALANLLAQKDLATLVDPDGNVVAAGVELKPGVTPDFLPKHNGSRHSSARRYSFEQHEAVVVVVSADGPVTVFTDGVTARELIQYGSPVGGAPEIILSADQRRNPWRGSAVTCDRCKKKSLVHRLNVEGYRTKQVVQCPVCKDPLIEEECSELQARLIKEVEP